MHIDPNPLRAGIGAALTTLALSAPFAAAQFYGDPPDETHPWAVHDGNRPQPPRVEPGAKPGGAPSDATVLFDGSAESFAANWVHENDKRKADWTVADGNLISAKGGGYIKSKGEFGDCQLHVEWAAPSKVEGSSQGRGNSGIFLGGGATEVQVLDNFDNPTYADGFAGSVYGVMPPEANPLHGPGEWQTYDIIFRRPIVKDGELVDPGSQTVIINGVVVQADTPLEGGGGHKGRSNPLRMFPEKGSIKIQDHGNPVRFRNIWIRELRPRPIDGGTDGQLSPEATAAKRAEIAAEIREDAETKSGKDKMLRLMESLVYAHDDAAQAEAEALGEAWYDAVAAAPDGKKGEVMQVNNALKYMVKHKRLPADHEGVLAVAELIKAQGWDQ